MNEFAAVTPLPVAAGSFTDMHDGITSVIFARMIGTVATFVKVTVQVAGPPVLSGIDVGDTDFDAVTAVTDGG